MAWARLDDTYCDHPKVLRAWSRHPAAVSLHVMSITYCARHRTDGYVPIEWLEVKVPRQNERKKVLEVLVDAGLFDLRDGEYYVHDFLNYNGSREDNEQRRAEISRSRAEAGRKGAQSRWQKDGKPMANADGNAEQDANGSNSPRPVPSRPDPLPPSPQRGNRKRDLAKQEQNFATWAAAWFPAVEPARVKHCVDVIRGARKEPTVEAVGALLDSPSITRMFGPLKEAA